MPRRQADQRHHGFTECSYSKLVEAPETHGHGGFPQSFFPRSAPRGLHARLLVHMLPSTRSGLIVAFPRSAGMGGATLLLPSSRYSDGQQPLGYHHARVRPGHPGLPDRHSRFRMVGGEASGRHSPHTRSGRFGGVPPVDDRDRIRSGRTGDSPGDGLRDEAQPSSPVRFTAVATLLRSALCAR